jgi:hypothetical protein
MPVDCIAIHRDSALIALQHRRATGRIDGLVGDHFLESAVSRKLISKQGGDRKNSHYDLGQHR